MAGILYLVPTPIGNLGDLSERIIETLREADFIAAEDTRVSLKILNHLGIKKPMVSYYRHNTESSGPQILSRILAGENCALVTDAGTPAISDPGEELVAQCAEAGVQVCAIPGPCALVTALAVSGLPTGRFTFEGFLAMNKKNRAAHLKSLGGEQRTMIFYEAPHKLRATLDDLLAAFETVIAGSEKKGTVITEEEKRIIAYHEVGHALVAAKQKNAQPVSKITIVPHTQGALGYTLHLPEEEKFLMSREDILAEIRTLLAGRSSEEVVCNTMTSGAANDIERATEMARNLVARFGMCDEFDMMALGSVQSQYLDGGYSMTCAQETYAAADRETIKILRQCHEEAKQILRENRELLDKIAAYLLKKETITGQEMMAIIEGRDPETVDNYGASKSSQPAFRPSVPETIEAPARHINIVSEPIPMPDYDEKPEDKDPEGTPAEDKPAEHADGDPE